MEDYQYSLGLVRFCLFKYKQIKPWTYLDYTVSSLGLDLAPKRMTIFRIMMAAHTPVVMCSHFGHLDHFTLAIYRIDWSASDFGQHDTMKNFYI